MGESVASFGDRVRQQLTWKSIPVALLTVGIVVLMIRHLVEFEDLIVAREPAALGWFVVPLALIGVALVLAGWRFRLALGGVDHELTVRRALEVVLAVWPLALIAPSRANDLLRAVVLRREVPPSRCLGAILAERAVDVQTLALFGIVGCAWMGAWRWMGVAVGVWSAVWLGIIVLLMKFELLVSLPVVRRFETKLRHFVEAIDNLRRDVRYLAGLVGVSALMWTTSLLILGTLVWMFGTSLPVSAVVGYWPLAIFVGMLPLTVGGLGTRDAAFLSLLLIGTSLDVEQSSIVAATLSYGIITVVLPALVGIPLMIREMTRNGDTR